MFMPFSGPLLFKPIYFDNSGPPPFRMYYVPCTSSSKPHTCTRYLTPQCARPNQQVQPRALSRARPRLLQDNRRALRTPRGWRGLPGRAHSRSSSRGLLRGRVLGDALALPVSRPNQHQRGLLQTGYIPRGIPYWPCAGRQAGTCMEFDSIASGARPRQ